MDVSGTLYTYPDNFRTYKILIAANYSGAEVKNDPKFIFGETNKSKDFLEKFPFGKVPTFLTSSNLPIFESSAIAYFVANDKLSPKTHYEKALMTQWICFGENEMLPPLCTWLFPYMGIIPFNTQNEEKAIVLLNKCLHVLEKHLILNTYLVGERISLADITVCSYLVKPMQMLFTMDCRKPYKNIMRWFNTLVHQPEFNKVLGDIKFCEKMPSIANVPKSVTQQPATATAKKDNKDKKKPPPKKADGDNSDMEDDPAITEEKSAKDPFSDMAKGTFNMDEFKRTYSNNETSVSIPFFWQKFDPENYSIWYCEYKYPEELKKDYMSCNLITGMFQRLDKLRKNAFASMILLGEENNFTISGIWVWKGQGLVFELSPDWQIDFESYTWKKLNPSDENTKKLVNSYFSWDGDFGGKKFSQGKIFK